MVWYIEGGLVSVHNVSEFAFTRVYIHVRVGVWILYVHSLVEARYRRGQRIPLGEKLGNMAPNCVVHVEFLFG